jgi:hypothetical protein
MMTLIWKDQQPNKQLWPSFTTPTGKKVTLPPRRYILFTTSRRELQDPTIKIFQQTVSQHHQLITAPEPLSTLSSHLQLMKMTQEVPDPDLPDHQYVLSLTNTSSRTVRQKIFAAALSILSLQPVNMILQEGSDKTPLLSYSTPDLSTTMTVPLESKDKKEHLLHEHQETDPSFLSHPLQQIYLHHRPPYKGTILETMLHQTTLPSHSSSIKKTSPI